jgi:hypothetical protein
MAICRCQEHMGNRCDQSRNDYLQPMGYSETGTICDNDGCQEQGLIWLANEEVWEYIKGKMIFAIEGATVELKNEFKKGETPPILYKYVSWNNDYHRKILIDNKTFFCSVCKFNDPFDGSSNVNINIENLPYDKKIEFIKKLISARNLNLSEDEINNLAKKSFDPKLTSDPENIIFSQIFRQDLACENFGILSLSETPNNILMWSHYANSHQGICIGFNTTILKRCFDEASIKGGFSIIPFKVSYKTERLDFEPLKEPDYNFKNQFAAKFIDWSYEKEWRYILLDRTNIEIYIPNEAISTIIFGSMISQNDRINIIESLRRKNMNILLLKSWNSLKNYKLQHYRVRYYIRHD